MSQTEGLRALRTRTLVQTAAMELCEDGGFDELTVTALVDRAMVSRATFYRYYRDKYDVIEKICAAAFDRLSSAADKDSERRRARWIEFFEYIARNDRFYKALLVESRQGWFAHYLQTQFASLAVEHASNDSNIFGAKTPVALSQILASTFVETITWWIARGTKRSCDPQRNEAKLMHKICRA